MTKMQKLLTYFYFQQNMSVYAILNNRSFNDTLTDDIISFEQLGPDVLPLIALLAVKSNAGITTICR